MCKLSDNEMIITEKEKVNEIILESSYILFTLFLRM